MATDQSTSTSDIEVFKNGIAWYEMNLIRNPFCVLSKNDLQRLLVTDEEDMDPDGAEPTPSRYRRQLVYRTTNQTTGERVEWKVKPDAERGYPGPLDQDLIVTVKKLATDKGFPPENPLFLPSWRQMCRLMKMPPSHTKYVRESAERIAGTVIETNNFHIKNDDGKAAKVRNRNIFTLWSYYSEGEELPDGTTSESTCLWFNPPFYESLLSFYVRPIDYDYYLSLSPLAKRIYIVQGRKFFGLKDSPYTQEEYVEWCHQLPSAPQTYFSKAKQVLNRPHKQLQKDKFFGDVRWEGSSRKKPWYIRYYPGERALQEKEEGLKRLRQFSASQQHVEDWQDVQAWAKMLGDELEDTAGRNRGFYIKLGKLVVQGKIKDNLIWEAVSNAKVEDREGNVRKGRSAFFTDYLKRQLNERDQDLNELLQEA